MRKQRTVLASLAIVVATAAASTGVAAEDQKSFESGEWTIGLDGHYKLRGQFDAGKDFLGDEAVNREWITHRARLGIIAARKGGPRVVVRFQDTRVWGEETDPVNGGTTPNAGLGVDLHEAYAWLPLGVDGLSLQAGRQEIILDTHRLVGNLDWVMRARRFDAVRLRFNKDQIDASVFGAPLAERDAVDLDGHVAKGGAGDVWFGGFHGRYTVPDVARVSATFLSRKNDAIAPAANELRHTTGIHAEGKSAGVTWSVEGYYQLGRQGAVDLGAYMASARASYAIPFDLSPFVGFQFDELSGDGNVATAFDTLYGTNHKFYGEMDHFLNIPLHTSKRGLRDIIAFVGCAPTKSLNVSADFHLFAAHDLAGEALTKANNVQPAGDLGKELDLRALWKFMPEATLHAIYGVFLPGEGMRTIRPTIKADDTLTVEHWGALTLEATY